MQKKKDILPQMNANVRESRGHFGHDFEHQVRTLKFQISSPIALLPPPSAIFASFVFKSLFEHPTRPIPHLRSCASICGSKNWVAGEARFGT